ncbi:MAG: acyl-CoA dehydrogenase family protein [Candidatus Dormibacteraeota bacterium]|nr:acyl-CoA dehydrogenase family protein [Candidatus Dormibacteraeota bacterium]MBV9525418.1 acyl-CoA dehydrogenase family protein [Candidatus Dormibacteraeota bacterium]
MPLDFSLTPEQEEIRNLAHEFAEKEMRPVADHYDEHEETPWDVMRKAHDLGLDPASGFPEEYGGGGVDLVTSLILQEELAWGDAGMAVAIGASGLAGAGIIAMGTEEQKKKYVGMLCDPKELRIAAMGLTEPNSGSDSLSLETTAKKVDGGYVLNGTKQFCTNGGIADIQVVFATTDKALGPAGIAGFVIEKGNPGMRQGRKERKLGVRASHTAQVIMEDCFVPEDARLGFDKEGNATGPGAVGAMLMLEATRPLVAAGAIGIARAAFEFARDYSLERHAFGKPIAKHEAIAFKLADMATEIDAARLLMLRAGWMAMNGIPYARGEGSMAKLFAGDMAMRVTTDAVQVLGGYGYVKEYPVERFMRDAKIYQIWEGTAEIQRLVISRFILGERRAMARPKLVKDEPAERPAAKAS